MERHGNRVSANTRLQKGWFLWTSHRPTCFIGQPVKKGRSVEHAGHIATIFKKASRSKNILCKLGIIHFWRNEKELGSIELKACKEGKKDVKYYPAIQLNGEYISKMQVVFDWKKREIIYLLVCQGYGKSFTKKWSPWLYYNCRITWEKVN